MFGLFNKRKKETDNSALHKTNVSGSFIQEDKQFKIRQQEVEDRRFYAHVKAEAIRQINRPEGWIIDISRARLMQIYNIYDEETAKYKNVDSLKMCQDLIKELS